MRDSTQWVAPEITDHGSIAEHTFTRCGGSGPPKDFRPFGLDKFGECSEGHGLS